MSVSTTTTKGVWKLQDVRDNILNNQWTQAGNLYGWGVNSYGELGVNNIVACYASPIQIPSNSWNSIAAGAHSLAIKTDGTLWTWGCNIGGQLGDNTRVSRSSPVQIPGTTWNDISASGQFSLARKTDGTLWSWGKASGGNLGDGTVVNKSSPVQIPGTTWNDIAAAGDPYNTGNFSLARKTDGTLWAWGYNIDGNLGDNTIVSKSSPVQIPGTTWNDIAAAGIVNQFSGGEHFFSLARKTDGTLWAWGDNCVGQLGQNTIVRRSSPVQIPGTTWNDIAAGMYMGQFFGGNFSLARKTDGTLWAWGGNDCGMLGDGTVINRSLPVQIPGTTWSSISAGSGAADGGFGLALKTNGTLWAWGYNFYGQLGDNTFIDKSSPIQIPGTSWNRIAAGGGHSLAIICM